MKNSTPLRFLDVRNVWKSAKLMLLCLASLFFAAQGSLALAASPDLPAEFKPDANGKFLLVDFYTPFCGTCQMMEPHVKAIIKKTEDKVNYKHVDISQPNNTKYQALYNITGTPTYILFNPEGKAVYKMENTISPKILETQVLRQIQQLSTVPFPHNLALPTANQGPQSGALTNLLLVSFENKTCGDCKDMSPYLSGFEMSGQEGLHIMHLDTDTANGKQLMHTLAIKKLPAYVLFDNQSKAPSSRPELFRVEGNVSPKSLWNVIRVFGDAGV